MKLDGVPQGTAADPPAATKDRARKKRLVGIDAARGLALIGLMAVHIFPAAIEDTGEPTLAWELFSGDSAALFALLAGVGVALSSGGQRPHRSLQMTATRAGLLARAVMLGIVALVLAQMMPTTDAAYNSILLYYAVFFLLSLPFLSLRPRTLFLSAGAFGLVSPVLMSQLYPVLPQSSVYNHTLWHLFTEPLGVASELLLTGAYPALTFMTYLLVGVGLGRLDLRSTRVQVLVTGTGAAVAVLANLVSFALLHGAGGYQALLATPGMTRDSLEEALLYGPEILPATSPWWLAIATPHSGATLAIAASLGIGMAVLGVFLLIGARAGRWLTPLAAMGAMTLTLYTAHLLALVPGLHHEAPAQWFLVHLGAAVVVAWAWHLWLGKGPLETIVARVATGARRQMADGIVNATTGAPAAGTPAANTEGFPTDPRQISGPHQTG